MLTLDRSIGDIFVEQGFVSRDEMQHILGAREDTREPVGDLLVRLKKISEKQKLHCVGLQLGVSFVDLAKSEIAGAIGRAIPHAAAMRLLAIPIELTEDSAIVAMVDPLDLAALDELGQLLGRDVDPMLSTEGDVRDAIFRVYGAYDDLGEIIGEAVRGVDVDGVTLSGVAEDEPDSVNVIELREVGEGAPVVKLANALLIRAITMRASDVHIEPHQRRVRVRVRIDGLLQEAMVVPKDLQLALASRLKLMAGLDIAERRAPQDGRCTLVSPQGEYDFRVSTYPSSHGETIVVRILDKNAAMMDLERLGMSGDSLRAFRRRLTDPQGLVLINGPTGSGKTTTLYAGLHHLNSVERNIITIEDPVEYQLEGITQGNVNVRAGITFATGLRSILRQDPDVILVGEVRDGETAQISVEAALTGHLVLTSLHANDSVGALTRLIDMGIEPFLLGASVTCSVAQRLLRMVCPKCGESYRPDGDSLRRLGLPPSGTYLRGRGCEHCSKTGFRGRVGVYEVLEISPEVRRLILNGSPASEIKAAASRSKFTTLREDAAEKVLQGLTTVEEVLRITAEGH